ncbi:MAG TPA: hypothetical protein VF857_01845, partial [Spirochaetota bacterium]
MKKIKLFSLFTRFDFEIGVISGLSNLIAMIIYQLVISQLVPERYQVDESAILSVVPHTVFVVLINVAPFI